VEAGSNTSTVALRAPCHPVPAGYKYGDLTLHVGGSLESETVKYAPKIDSAVEDQQQL
jgi:hypothetical protein